MKIMFKTFTALLILILCVSCKNESLVIENQKLDGIPMDSVQFFGKSFSPFSSTTSVKKNFTNTEAINSIYSATFELNPENYNTLLQEILISFDLRFDTSKSKTFVLYLNGFNKSITRENVLGLSIFTKEANGLIHSYYVNSVTGLKKVTKLSGIVGGYSTSDFDILLSYSLQELKNPIKPANIIFNCESGFAKEYSSTVESLSSLLIDNNINLLMYAEGGCGSSCAKGDGGCSGEICDECASSQTEEVAKLNDIDFNVEKTFPKMIAYDFRDNFLKQNTLGKKYVKYYYELSYFTKAKRIINAENFWSHVELGTTLYKIAKILKNGNDSDIVVSGDYKSEIDKMLNHYKTCTKNESLLYLLNDVEHDMSFFEGKSRKEVLISMK